MSLHAFDTLKTQTLILSLRHFDHRFLELGGSGGSMGRRRSDRRLQQAPRPSIQIGRPLSLLLDSKDKTQKLFFGNTTSSVIGLGTLLVPFGYRVRGLIPP
jgi:hypothetical protein